MKLDEVCKVLGKSESTIKNAFKRTQKNLAKKGIILTKEGVGKDAEYIITYNSNNIKEGE